MAQPRNLRRARRRLGRPFGAALWFGADEIAVPAVGLSQAVKDIFISTYASAFAMHLVYGATTESVRRLVLTDKPTSSP